MFKDTPALSFLSFFCLFLCNMTISVSGNSLAFWDPWSLDRYEVPFVTQQKSIIQRGLKRFATDVRTRGPQKKQIGMTGWAWEWSHTANLISLGLLLFLWMLLFYNRSLHVSVFFNGCTGSSHMSKSLMWIKFSFTSTYRFQVVARWRLWIIYIHARCIIK